MQQTHRAENITKFIAFPLYETLYNVNTDLLQLTKNKLPFA